MKEYKAKPYRAKSILGAERRVHMLETRLAQCRNQVVLLAKLAAKGPAFFNPLEAMAAEQLRDKILRTHCRLTPEGKPIQ